MNLSPLNSDSNQQASPLSNRSEKSQDKKLEGFVFLRSVFSIAIVALHSKLFLLTENFKLGSLSLGNILEANVAYLAVPVFFQISLFLFYIKSEKLGSSYFFQRRLPKLISLYLFWVALKVLFDVMLNRNIEALQNNISSPRRAIEFIVSGGSSPLYFFFSLIFITFLTEIIIFSTRRIKKRATKTSYFYILLILACILIFIFGISSQITGVSINSDLRLLQVLSNLAKWDYNPLNFLPYIFTTAIAVIEFNDMGFKGSNSNLKLKIYTLLFLFLVFTFLEWNYSKDLLHYARLSLVFGSWLLLYLALLSTRKAPSIVQFISGCSLGIYTLHLLFTHGLLANESNIFSPLSEVLPSLAILAEFLVALIGSIVLTLLFRKIKFLKGFV